MKSLKSIAQQKNLDLKKIEHVASELTTITPLKMGSTSLYSEDDAKTIMTAYYQKYIPVVS